MEKRDKKFIRLESAAENMTALLDDVIKAARKSFKATGKPELDAKFLKESVGALREIYGILGEGSDLAPCDSGIVIRLEGEIGEFAK